MPRSSRLFVSLLLVLALLFSTGCGGSKQQEQRAAAVKQPAVPREIGKIALVNPDLGFALIDVDMGFAPLPGAALKTFPPGVDPAPDTETSILTVSAERRPPFIAVDIVRGQPEKGDAVYQ